MSRRNNGRHRRRSPLRRAAPAVATTAGSVALVTTIGTAAFWLVPGDQRLPFGGSGPGSTGAAPPTAELIIPTGTTSTSTPRGSADSHPRNQAVSAAAAAAKPRQTTGSRSKPRPQLTSSTPRPSRTAIKPPTPPVPITTPPLVTGTITVPFLPVSVTASVTVPGLP